MTRIHEVGTHDVTAGQVDGGFSPVIDAFAANVDQHSRARPFVEVLEGRLGG